MISATQRARRYLALAFIGFWAGCVAYASPGPVAVDCYSQIAPNLYCEAEFVWVPGYWTLDYYGRRVWNPGYYQRRMPQVRDHR
jgi:hypothetical protein